MASITLNTGLRRKYRHWRTDRGLRRSLESARKAALREPSPATNRDLLAARHRYATWLAEGNSKPLDEMAAASGRGIELNEFALPEIAANEMTSERLRDAILGYGALLVRGLVEPERAKRYASGIDSAYESRSADGDDEVYLPFLPSPPYAPLDEFRPWIEEAGGLLAVDCPGLHAEMLEFVRDSGLRETASDYLGGPA
ncbi:MAG: hypothetical protein ACKOBH_03225, partial [bacterium]